MKNIAPRGKTKNIFIHKRIPFHVHAPPQKFPRISKYRPSSWSVTWLDILICLGTLILRPSTLRPLKTTSKSYDPGRLQPKNITSKRHYVSHTFQSLTARPPLLRLDVLSHVTRCPTSFTWIVKWCQTFLKANLDQNVTSHLDIPCIERLPYIS
jgi:hypothetical protein